MSDEELLVKEMLVLGIKELLVKEMLKMIKHTPLVKEMLKMIKQDLNLYVGSSISCKS